MLCKGMADQTDNISGGTQDVWPAKARGTNRFLVQPADAKRCEVPWPEVNAWRKELHRDFERALAETKLPERPDYEAANHFLVKARRQMTNQ